MKKFVEVHEQEVLLLLVTIVGITRSWIPQVRGFDNIYVASQWVLSYDHGLIRRGLIGTLMKVLKNIVTIEDVQSAAFVAYCLLLSAMVVAFFTLLKNRDKGGRLFRVMLIFVATPATIALVAHDLGRFDLFLTAFAFLSMVFLSLNKYLWVIPFFLVAAMFVHESFFVLYAPTIIAALVFMYRRNGREKKTLAILVVSGVTLVAAYFILSNYGTPTLGYEGFSRLIQARAAFHITSLSIRECYFGIRQHIDLASSSFFDAGSMANLLLTLIVLSPVFLILLNLWMHARRNCGAHRGVCDLMMLATLSGFIVVPIATDYGRWLSAIVFCNFFAIFFLVARGTINVEELTEYEGSVFTMLSAFMVLAYLLFGPFNDWNPFPYRENLIASSLSIIAVLMFDAGFLFQWREFHRKYRSYTE